MTVQKDAEMVSNSKAEYVQAISRAGIRRILFFLPVVSFISKINLYIGDLYVPKRNPRHPCVPFL